MSNIIEKSVYEKALSYVDAKSKGDPIDRSLRITLNFHPDRQNNGIQILDALLQEGVYRSQYETGTSNGGLTAHPGGDRWSWESRMFGAAYDNSKPSERPKYGSLNYKNSTYGGSPRFGSSYFRLTEQCLDRATFCYPDSVFSPEDFGTSAHMSLVEIAKSDSKDFLDDYIEAHVHGVLNISTDIEALVLDPSFKGAVIEETAKRLPCKLEWHEGYHLPVDLLTKNPDYRGQEYVDLGVELAQKGVITPKIIGDAASTGIYNEQDLKRVWHYVARFGVK